jgi:hypothetical protein
VARREYVAALWLVNVVLTGQSGRVPNRIDDLRNPIWRSAPVLPPDVCSTLPEAKRALGLRRWSTVQHRAHVGFLDKCIIDGRALGVTKESVDRELAWWKTATFPNKIKRRLREAVSYF